MLKIKVQLDVQRAASSSEKSEMKSLSAVLASVDVGSLRYEVQERRQKKIPLASFTISV